MYSRNNISEYLNVNDALWEAQPLYSSNDNSWSAEEIFPIEILFLQLQII